MHDLQGQPTKSKTMMIYASSTGMHDGTFVEWRSIIHTLFI